MNPTDDALLTIEKRVRSLVAARLAAITDHYGAYLAAVLRQSTHASALEILSRPDVHTALTTVLDGAAAQTETVVRAAWQAAARLAAATVSADLGPDTPDPARAYLDNLITDIHRAAATATLDITDSVRAAADATTDPDRRVLATHTALDRAVRRLGVRVTSAAVAAVYRAHTDTLLDLYTRYAADRGWATLVKRWETTATDPCPACAALDGTTIAVTDAFDHRATTDPTFTPPRVYRDLHGPPRHPNCFPAGAEVSGPGVQKAFARWYDGEMVEVRTQSGRVLTGTPNHPVLTTHGWAALGSIQQGTDLVCDRGLERVLDSDPDDYQQPAPIEQVASALRHTFGVTAVSVPMTAKDFHGDGADGQVNVVGTDRHLRDGVQIVKPGHQLQLGRAHAELSPLSRDRALRLLLDRVASAADSRVSGARESQSLGRAGVGHPHEHGLGTPPQFDSGLVQGTSERGATHLVALREALDALAGLVSTDQVVQIRWLPFSGHVYNLETSGGWYICNKIIVHNCRCRVDITHTDTAAALRAETNRRPPVRARTLSAADIRRMPPDRYDALIAFLTATLRANRRLQNKGRTDG